MGTPSEFTIPVIFCTKHITNLLGDHGSLKKAKLPGIFVTVIHTEQPAHF
jgi:hypothetical protein